MSPAKMGTLPLKILFFLVYFGGGIFICFIKAELQTCSNDMNMQKCCLCANIDRCTEKCPDGYTQTEMPCNNEGESTRGTTLNPSLTTQQPSLATPGNETASNISGSICVKCGPDEFFNDNSTNCEDCSSTCIGCYGPSEQECHACKYLYNNGCVPLCPHGFKPGNISINEHGNTTVCEATESKPESKDDKKKFIYIGVGIAGGVLVIIVVVVVVCIVLRKRNSMGTERRESKSTVRGTAMSQIINNRDNEGTDDKPPERPPGLKNKMGNAPVGRRHNYENTESPGPSFAKDIEQQQDNVLRYTKDPTVQKKKLEDQEKDRESSESVYENSTMVQLNRRFDLSKKSAEDIQTAIENQELQQLPNAPALPKPTKAKAGIVKRLSQRVSKKLASRKKAKPKEPELEPEPEQEDYIDMSKNEQELEDYENMAISGERKQPTQNQSTDKNGGRKTSSGNPSTAAEKVGRETRNQATEQGNQDDSGLEDYENLGNVKAVEEEDYENTIFRNKEPVKQEVEEEDYENTIVGNGEPDKKEAEQEDYENFGTLTKEESPYMNIAFKS